MPAAYRPYASFVAPRRLASNTFLVIRNPQIRVILVGVAELSSVYFGGDSIVGFMVRMYYKGR